MLAATGVDIGKIQMVDTPDYDPNQIIQGKLDAVDCYQSNEPLTLRAEGAQFNEFTPSEYGVSGTYNVQFFNSTFLKEHYAAAMDWMRAGPACFRILRGQSGAVRRHRAGVRSKCRVGLRREPRAAGLAARICTVPEPHAPG